MAFRLYIVPKVGTGDDSDPWRAKYFADGLIIPRPAYSAMDYGFEPWFVVGADLSSSDEAFVLAQSDVTAIPANLNANLTNPQVTSVQNKLESINIPAGWVNNGLQWLAVVRIVLGMFSFIQRFGSILNSGQTLGTGFFGSITLSTTIAELSANQVTALQQAAADLNLSTAGITGSTTLRVALKTLADQMSARTYNFNGVLI